MHSAIGMKFDKLSKLLADWDAKDEWVINKAGLLGLMDLTKARDLLNEVSQPNLQEHLYKLELLNYLKVSVREDEVRKNERRQLEAQGLQQVHKQIDMLLERLNRSTRKIKPYGSGKLSYSSAITLGEDTEQITSIQAIGLLMASGFQSASGSISLLGGEALYTVASKAFVAYPFPVLFYLLQSRDEKILKRLAQDYIYCDHIYDDERAKIVERLSSSYFGKATPLRFRESIPIFLSELILAVDPLQWEPFFERFWDEKIENGSLFVSHNDRENDFIVKAMRSIQSPSTFAKIIDDCIRALGKPEVPENTVSDYFYQLANNPTLEAKSSLIRVLLKEGFGEMIGNLCSKPSLIFAIGNIGELLNHKEEIKVAEQLLSMDFTKVDNPRAWRILLHFLGDATIDEAITDGRKRKLSAIKDMKAAILESDHLWHAGFRPEGGVSRTTEFISLRSLRIGVHPLNGLDWTKTEVEKLYELLLLTLNRIDKTIKRRHVDGGENIFAFILEEMRTFLIDEKVTLEHLPTYGKTMRLVERYHNLQRNYDYLLEGLTSSDHNRVLGATSELMELLYQDDADVESHEMHLIALLNKILLQSQPSIEACMLFVTTYLFKKSEIVFLKRLQPYLIEILSRYRKTLPSDCEIPSVNEYLIRIAHVLNKWGVENEDISHYLDMLVTSRYNNIKYGLQQRISSMQRSAS